MTLSSYLKINERGSSVRQEIIAGLTTFFGDGVFDHRCAKYVISSWISC